MPAPGATGSASAFSALALSRLRASNFLASRLVKRLPALGAGIGVFVQLALVRFQRTKIAEPAGAMLGPARGMGMCGRRSAWELSPRRCYEIACCHAVIIPGPRKNLQGKNIFGDGGFRSLVFRLSGCLFLAELPTLGSVLRPKGPAVRPARAEGPGTRSPRRLKAQRAGHSSSGPTGHPFILQRQFSAGPSTLAGQTTGPLGRRKEAQR